MAENEYQVRVSLTIRAKSHATALGSLEEAIGNYNDYVDSLLGQQRGHQCLKLEGVEKIE